MNINRRRISKALFFVSITAYIISLFAITAFADTTEIYQTFDTDIVSVKIEKLDLPSAGIYATLSIHSDKAQSPLLSKDAKYLYLSFSTMPMEQAVITENLKFVNQINDFAPLPIDSFSVPTGNKGSWYFCIYVLDKDKKPFGYLVNKKAIPVDTVGKTFNETFTFHQFALPGETVGITAEKGTAPEQNTMEMGIAPEQNTMEMGIAPEQNTMEMSIALDQNSTVAKSASGINPAGNGSIPAAAAAAAGVVVVLAGAGAVFFAANMADYSQFISIHKTSASKKLLFPVLYLKFRKHTLIVGRGTLEEKGVLIRRIKLLFKSGGKIVIDLTQDLDKTEHQFVTVRYPLKSMKNKQDIDILYHYADTLLDRDHFESDKDFVNIKDIEIQ